MATIPVPIAKHFGEYVDAHLHVALRLLVARPIAPGVLVAICVAIDLAIFRGLVMRAFLALPLIVLYVLSIGWLCALLLATRMAKIAKRDGGIIEFGAAGVSRAGRVGRRIPRGLT